MASRSSEDAGPLRLGGDGQSVAIDLDRDAIAMDREIDIATFRVGERDVKALGKKVLTGHQKAWPPAPPEERCGIYYAGYPGIGTRHPSPREGGLMLTVIQNRLRSWSLAGVIYQGPIHRRMKVKRLLGLKSSVRAALTLFCPMAGLTLRAGNR
jgi:hypothetical protein